MGTARNGVDMDEIEGQHLVDVSMHCTYLFPEATNLDCVLTAHADANTWSTRAEIQDNDGTPTTLSSKFASYDGHIAGMIIEETNQASTMFMVEVSYGAAKTCISKWRFLSETNNLPVGQSARARGVHIPAGETAYYRCMCKTAGSKTANVHFRYFLEE